jgi:c-di-GMP-binding flagellar brake protein YcgR
VLDSSLVKSTGTKVRCSNCREVFKVYPPSVVNRRKTPRVKTQNLISYFTYNENDKLISHGLGIALDISKGGILLETPYSMEPGLLVLNATDRNKNSIEVKGKLIYSKATSIGTFLCGIEFIGIDGRIRDFITKLIKEYHYQGNNLFIALKKRSHYLN